VLAQDVGLQRGDPGISRIGLVKQVGDFRQNVDALAAEVAQAAEVRRRVWHGPFDFSLGYKIDSFSFARIDLFHGYFSPKRFVAQSGIIEISGHKGRLHFDYDLALGSESYTRPIVASSAPSVFSQTHNSNFRVLLQVRNSLDLNKNLALQFSFLSFHTALSDGSGSFNANAILFGLRRRF